MPRNALAGMRLTELLGEVQDRLGSISRTQERVQGLLDAFLSVQTGLDLDDTLRRIVEVAVDLVDARYGALGVLSEHGGLARFIHVGVDAGTTAAMEHLPEGKGLLGQLITDPRPMRVDDLTQHPSSVGFPAGHPPMRSFTGVPLLVRGAVYGNLYLTEKRTGTFTAEDESLLSALAAAAGIAIDNARLFADAQVRQRWTTALADMRAVLLGGASPDDALRLITERVRELAGATVTFLLSGPDPLDGTWACRAQSGDQVDDMTGTRLTAESSPIVAAIEGADADRAVTIDLSSTTFDGPNDHLAWGPVVCVPLHTTDGGDAVLVVARWAGAEPFDPSLAVLAESFADQTALALDMAARQRAARQLDVFADRDRIARDLHDHVIQRLFAAGLSLQSVLPRLGQPDVRARVSQVVDQLDTTIRDIRTSIFDLHTTPGSEAGDSLRRRILDIVTEAAGPDLLSSVRTSGPVDTVVPGALAADLEAVVREAVTNVAKHARAEHVVVTVEAGEGVVCEVCDDGVGIGDRVARSGLRNLEDRAVARGGSFTAVATTTGGSRVRWTAPLP